MGVFDEPPPEEHGSGRTPLVVVGLVLVVVGAAIWFVSRRDDAPTSATAPVATPRPAAKASAPKSAPTPSPEPGAAAARRPEAKTAQPADAPAESAPPAGAAVLVVESDVPGASVFLDREFVGTTLVTLEHLSPGPKRLNLSAEGFDGISRTVEVAAGQGRQTVAVRFKEVRLDATTDVAHKHGVGGGCEGALRATVDGLAYQTSNTGDAFSLRYDQIETFEVSYLDKNLRVKQRGGKTWNFTDRRAENADRLFVFHRDVQAARDKLARGYAAAR